MKHDFSGAKKQACVGVASRRQEGMVFALSDLQVRINIAHIEAAVAWMRYATTSIRYVFVSANEEEWMSQTRQLCSQIHACLHVRGSYQNSLK